MISCEECQEKLVAIFDHEGEEGDKESTQAHLRDCPACRAFREDMIKLRQRFTSIVMPALPRANKDQLMQSVRADSVRRQNRRGDARRGHQPLLLEFPRLVWASGLAALFLVIISWLTCYMLTQKVSDLSGRLDKSQRELAAVRHNLAVAEAAKQLKEDHRKEQQAISALYFRMQELEDRFDRYSSSRATFLPSGQKGRSSAYGGIQADALREN